MIAAWMLYCVAIGLLFVVLGEALERALHLAGRATRWAWVAALAGSYLVPAAALLRPSAFAALPVPLAQPVVAELPATAMDQRVDGALPKPGPSFSLGDLDTALARVWGLSSAALLLSLGAAALRLAALRRGWRGATVDGRAVLVSDNVGPAVAGLWRSRIVLPDWALQLGEGERRLMLAHEDEHVRARDPWLLVAAAVAVVLAPWTPAVFAHPLPGAAVAFVFDAQDSLIGNAAGIRDARDNNCLAVVDRLVPAFHTRTWSSGGCAGTPDRGAVVVYWKKLKQTQADRDVRTESMVDERPMFLSGPPLEYPNLLRQAGIHGRVLVRAIIDTTGRAEPASVQVIESPQPGLNQAARNCVLQARFRHGRFRGRVVRVLITFPVDFRIS